MKKVAASVLLALALTGCSTADVLSAATSAITGGSKPEVTAQVGAENTKQGLGVKSEVTAEDRQELGDIKADTAVVTQSKVTKARPIEAGTVNAKNVTVVQSNPTPLLVAFTLGLLAVLGVVAWFTRRQTAKKEEK